MNAEKKKIKIVLIAPSMREIGGQSIQANRILESFSNHSEIEMLFVANNPSTLFQSIKILRTFATFTVFVFSLFAKLSSSDCVHIFSSGTTSYIISTLPALLVAKLFRKKTILHYHTGEAETHLKKWKLTAKPTMKWFDKIIVPSHFLVEVFARFGLKTEAIFNSVDSKKFQFRVRNPIKPIFLSNRNFENHYQVSDILRAFQIIKTKIPDAKLLVVGSGSEEKLLKNLAVELQLLDIEFIGKIDQNLMPETYNHADIYLNSSVVDNMPLSIIEAFSCGLAIVTTNSGGIPFIIRNEFNGLIVEQNDFKSLAESAIQLVVNNSFAQELIYNGRNEIKKYDMDLLQGSWVKCYLEAVKCV